jgi:hypothetical protein
MKLGASTNADNQEKVKALTGEKTGLQMKTTWICYADKHMPDDKEFGLLEMKKTVRDAIMDLNIIEDEEEAFTSDVFTDIEEGRLALITYDSNAKKASDYYKTAVSKKVVPLSDEDLEAFDAVTPLSKLEMFSYSRKDFQLALEGIEYFDNLHEINLFDDEDFQEIVASISKGVGGSVATDAKSEKVAPKAKPKPKPEPEEAEEEEEEEVKPKAKSKKATDKFDEMDRNELKVFKNENEINDFKVFQTTTDDQIRDGLREWEMTQNAEEEVEEVEEVEEEEETEVKPKANLSALRKKMGLK